MKLNSRSWGSASERCVVCVHGIGQHGGIFEELGERLAGLGHATIAVDLRGHGDSGREPPWNTETHVRDLLDTLGEMGVERVTWVGHSFGGRVVASAAAAEPGRTDALVLLDPAYDTHPAAALRSAETERLDWSFATVDGAVNAQLSNDLMVAPPHDVIRRYVEDDLRQGPDGRYRFRFSPSAAVVALSEVTLSAPPITRAPTLLLLATVSTTQAGVQLDRHRDALGDLLTEVVVPNGHNVLWESPAKTIAAIEEFLGQQVT